MLIHWYLSFNWTRHVNELNNSIREQKPMTARKGACDICMLNVSWCHSMFFTVSFRSFLSFLICRHFNNSCVSWTTLWNDTLSPPTGVIMQLTENHWIIQRRNPMFLVSLGWNKIPTSMNIKLVHKNGKSWRKPTGIFLGDCAVLTMHAQTSIALWNHNHQHTDFGQAPAPNITHSSWYEWRPQIFDGSSLLQDSSPIL